MHLVYAGLLFLTIVFSCKIAPDSSRQYDAFDKNKIYKLQLNPPAGTSYYYDIDNESVVELEVDDKEIKNITRSSTGLNYRIGKDSAGNFTFRMNFDKVKLYTKSGDTETEADALNAAVSINPLERMLGILQKANFQVLVNPAGDVIRVDGYEEVGDQIMAGFAPDDHLSRDIAQKQWDRLIGAGIIKRNMDQFFKVFPDSSVHLFDTWRLDTRQEGEVPMNVKSNFKLKAINDEIALIESEGKLTSDSDPAVMAELGSVFAKLTGEQSGQFEMEAKTGMLISCEIEANIKGVIQAMGREIPISIKSTVSMKGKRTGSQ